MLLPRTNSLLKLFSTQPTVPELSITEYLHLLSEIQLDFWSLYIVWEQNLTFRVLLSKTNYKRILFERMCLIVPSSTFLFQGPAPEPSNQIFHELFSSTIFRFSRFLVPCHVNILFFKSTKSVRQTEVHKRSTRSISYYAGKSLRTSPKPL